MSKVLYVSINITSYDSDDIDIDLPTEFTEDEYKYFLKTLNKYSNREYMV